MVGIEAFVPTPPAAPLTGVEADPSGIRLGQTRSEIATARPGAKPWTDDDGNVHLQEQIDDARGLVADYRFSGDRLVADTWLVDEEKDGPPLPGAVPYADPAGDSPATAILDAQTRERDGIDWEYVYLRFHPCGGAATWRATGQSVTRVGDRWFDVLQATCPDGGATRTFFFDITSFFGKP
ncbi:MAG TPA: hypothetical protein VHT05_01580 [Candidatus Elarobacter sp.]|nr:hypothetical protein [Candidatus Elarobacter sp.]